MITLDTERLILRPPALEDFEEYASMFADPEVMRFIGIDGKPMSRFGAWQSFSGQVGHWHLRGFGMFSVIDRQTGDLIGRVGPLQPEEWPDFEIGWTLRSQYWGRGYATEAARACLPYAFEELGRQRIISLIAPENQRSIRVAERLGERLEGQATLPHMLGRPVLQFALRQDEWRQRG
jgi:RimJ/RimL family protein N-acetyltransferase